MINQQLADYINQSKAVNIADSQIKAELLNAGWPAKDIDEAFKPLNPILAKDFKKGLSTRIIITVAIVILLIGILVIAFWFMDKKFNLGILTLKSIVQNNVELNKPLPINENVAPNLNIMLIEENPDDIVIRLNTASLLNDYDYLIPHSYCDSNCETLLKDDLGMSVNENWNLDKKISAYNEQIIINDIGAQVTSKTDKEADYLVNVAYGFVDNPSTVRISFPSKLIKVDSKWMMDMNEALPLVIPVFKNYIKIFSDLEKCQEMGPVEFNIPKAGGKFTISNPDHPLKGFSIRLPKLKEAMKIKIGCYSDFFPISQGSFFVSLPISIESDKNVYFNTLDPEDLWPGIAVSVKNVEADPTLGGKWPFIEIPYYDLAIDDKKLDSLAMAIISNKTPNELKIQRYPNIDVLTFEYDTDTKTAKAFFADLPKTWVLFGSAEDIKPLQ